MSRRSALEELAQLFLKKEVVDRPELQAILKVVSIERAKERKKAFGIAEGEGTGVSKGRKVIRRCDDSRHSKPAADTEGGYLVVFDSLSLGLSGLERDEFAFSIQIRSPFINSEKKADEIVKKAPHVLGERWHICCTSERS